MGQSRVALQRTRLRPISNDGRSAKVPVAPFFGFSIFPIKFIV